MASGDLEDFGTSSKRVQIHVNLMGFARWNRRGAEYDVTAPSA